MKEYLEYVRSSPRYASEFLESYFEWREDVPDGLEVSTYSKVPSTAPAAASGSSSETGTA